MLASEACVSGSLLTGHHHAVDRLCLTLKVDQATSAGCVLVNAWLWTVLRGREVFLLSWPQQEYILGSRRVRVKLWIVLKKSLHLLTLHHPSRAEKGLSSSDCVRSLVTNLWAPCAPRGHFLHSHPGGLCRLISEQAVLSNLPLLPISRELKVQIVDLILLISSRTLLGLYCSHMAESWPSHHWFCPGMGLPAGKTHFPPSCGVPCGPLSCFAPSSVGCQQNTQQKKPETTMSFVSAPAETLGLVAGFGKWYTAFPGISQSSGSSAFMTCTLSPQHDFHYLVFHLPGLRPRLETFHFLCLELELLINHVMMQNLQCKLRKYILLYSMSAELGFFL